MTRKKWLKLRRSRPDLFTGFPSSFNFTWERLSKRDRESVLRISTRDAIAQLTAYKLGHDERDH